MSRRRDPADHADWRMFKAPKADEGQAVVSIVCTDRATHNTWRFGYVILCKRIEGDGFRVSVRVIPGASEYSHHESVIESIFKGESVPESIPKTWPLECKRCRRKVPMKKSTIDRLCTELAQAGHATLDISMIPS